MDNKENLLVIQRYQTVQIRIDLTSPGRVVFPDVPNLRGANIQSIIVIPGEISNTGLQSGASPVLADSDLQNIGLTFVSGSDQVIQQIPAYFLAPFTGSNITQGNLWREVMNNKELDWNKCYLEIWTAPTSDPIYMNLGVFYSYPVGAKANLQFSKNMGN